MRVWCVDDAGSPAPHSESGYAGFMRRGGRSPHSQSLPRAVIQSVCLREGETVDSQYKMGSGLTIDFRLEVKVLGSQAIP